MKKETKKSIANQSIDAIAYGIGIPLILNSENSVMNGIGYTLVGLGSAWAMFDEMDYAEKHPLFERSDSFVTNIKNQFTQYMIPTVARLARNAAVGFGTSLAMGYEPSSSQKEYVNGVLLTIPAAEVTRQLFRIVPKHDAKSPNSKNNLNYKK